MLGPLSDGDVIDLSSLPTSKLNIRANTNPPVVGSVRFDMNGTINVRTENSAPYTIAGDAGGNYFPMNFSTGTYTFTATSFEYQDAGGEAGAPLTVTVQFIQSANRQGNVHDGSPDLNTYPNPTGDQIILDMIEGRKGKVQIEVFSIQGKRVQEALFETSTINWRHKLNLQHLPAGTYSIIVKNEDVRINTNVIKQ